MTPERLKFSQHVSRKDSLQNTWPSVAMQQTTQAYLVIQLGSRWTDILRLQPGHSIGIGRSSECQIVVKDERVSRHHARVSPHEGGWFVEDLGSRNGTQVDGATIDAPHRLRDGELISVGGATMAFTYDLTRGFARAAPADGNQATVEALPAPASNPTIVNRLAKSQWSGEIAAPGIPSTKAAKVAEPPRDADAWNFFYRLVFDLVSSASAEAAAQVALDRLLAKLGISAGGVVLVDPNVALRVAAGTLSVLATRQASGASYRRVSDFLVENVLAEQQAVLARNVKDDSKLSVAHASVGRETVSVICAPLKIDLAAEAEATKHDSAVVGLLHVYSAGDERMLTREDLELVVGVADNLAIALQRQRASEQLASSLKTTQEQVTALQQQLDQSATMVGNSRAMAQVRKSIQLAAPTNATVLVRGESGVGKELVARGIHSASKRSKGPLICLNCAALAPTLLESELFGHEKGAFTGATERKIGKFEAADGGTLLLDEIGEMPLELQAKFLRVLEGQPFERLGGQKSISTDVRVIAATNRALEDAVEAKEFRADLYYRLRVIEIVVPALRERMDDVPLLVEHFVQQLKHHAGRRLTGITPAALQLLTTHSWPGNVRELRNVLERAIVLGGSSVLQPEDLSMSSLGAGPSADSLHGTPYSVEPVFVPVSLAELERQHIMSMLEHVEGNKTKASQLLGIERSTLDRKLKKFAAEGD